MLNSLSHSESFLNEAKYIIDKNTQEKDTKYHGIIYRIMGYQYWKFYKKSKAQEYLNKALSIFEKLKDSKLIASIYKEKGDMHKEILEMEDAEKCYDLCLKYSREVYQDTHYGVSKVYFRMADNVMRERGNLEQLKRAGDLLQKDYDTLKIILDIESDEELETSSNLYLALHY